MPRCRQHCGRWLQTTSHSQQDHVWISETLLGSTLQSFFRSSKRFQSVASSAESCVTSKLCKGAYCCVALGPRPSVKQITEQQREYSQKHHTITNTQCRFASAVPGPLEARRRSSKRKNTSLAQFGRPPASIDPGWVFGSSRPCEWWNGRPPPPAEEEKEAPQQYSLLPSWLTNVVPNPEPPVIESQLEPRTEGLAYETSRTSTKESVDELYARELKNIHDLESLRNLVQSLGISLHQKKEYVRQPLRLMLEDEWQLEHIRTFLFDPFFENPVSRKWREIYRYLSQTSVTQERLHDLLDLSVEAIRLGVVDLPEIKTLVRGLPRVKVGHTILGNLPNISEWYSRIIDAIGASPIKNLSSFGTEFRLWLIRVIIEAPYWEDTPSILWRICPETSESAFVLSTNLDKWLKLRSIDANDGDITIPVNALTKFFCQLNNGDIVKGAIDCSVFLITHTSAVPSGERHIKAWIEQVGELKASLQKLNAFTDQSHSGTTRGMEKNLFQASRQQAMLIRIWALRRLGFNDVNGLRSIVANFWNEVQEIASPSSIPLCDLIASIQSLGLPSDETELLTITCLDCLPSPEAGIVPLPKMVAETQREDTFSKKPQVSFEQLQDFAKSQILSMKPIFAFMDGKSWWYLCGNLQPVLRLLAERVNESFDTFVLAGRSLIFREPFAALMIMRLLRFNLPFKLALGMSRTHADPCHSPGGSLITRVGSALQKQKRRESEGTSNSLGVIGHNDDSTSSSRVSGRSLSSSTTEYTRKFTLTPNGALETMEVLAATFAVTPVLTPRQAFRRVWQCYYILRRYQAPLRPVITRCLWHAGVKRYGKQGCSKTQFSWILQQIARVEGRQVAEKLIAKVYDSPLDDLKFWEGNLDELDSAIVDQDTLTEARSWETMNAPPAMMGHGWRGDTSAEH